MRLKDYTDHTRSGDYLYNRKHPRARYYKSISDLLFYGLVAILITIIACIYVRNKLDMTPPAPWTVEQPAEREEPINFYWIE